MTNGQLNAVAVLPATQMAAQGQVAPAETTAEGVQEVGGTFAGMLSGIQAQAKEKVVADSGQAEISQVSNGKEPSGDAQKEPSVDMLALIQVSPQVLVLPEPVAQKSEEPVKADNIGDSLPMNSASTTAASQMAQAAYVPSGRMPEVNFPTQQIVDRPQNVAVVSESPSVRAASPVEKLADAVASQSTASAQSTVSIKPSDAGQAVPDSVQAEHSGRTPAVNTQAELTGDRLQNKALIKEQLVVDVATDSQTPVQVELQTQKTSVQLAEVPPSATVQSVPDVQTDKAAVVLQAAKPAEPDGRMVVGTLTTRSGDAASDAGKQAPTNSVPDETQVTQPVQVNTAQVTDVSVEKNAAVAMADGSHAQQAAPAVEIHTKSSDKTAPVSSRLKSDVISAGQEAATPVSAQEPDIEIQLSQPRPITARVSAAPVSFGNHFAALVQETRADRQRTNPEQEQQDAVNKMASSQQAAVLTEEVAVSSDPSRSDDGTQNQSDVASDNLLSVQDMRGQLKTEHQKVATFSTKQVPTEPVRENISEQVVQQVKERLVQHEVKPGNQQITLTLSPDSLGELKMNLNLQGQKLSVEIVTENKAVRDSIVQHADALKDSLGRQNITMESFDVTTGGKGSGNQGQNQNQNQNAWRELAKQQQQQQFWTSTRGYAAQQADLPAGNVAYMKQQGQSMLDIHY